MSKTPRITATIQADINPNGAHLDDLRLNLASNISRMIGEGGLTGSTEAEAVSYDFDVQLLEVSGHRRRPDDKESLSLIGDIWDAYDNVVSTPNLDRFLAVLFAAIAEGKTGWVDIATGATDYAGEAQSFLDEQFPVDSPVWFFVSWN